MSRRRYLSTDISVDTAVNRLARTAGDFAVMLYTWMIPHCDDDGIVRGDAEEIMLQVIPGRRDKRNEDVTAALGAMQEHGLIAWDEPGRRVVFPAASFYKYQTYIKPERRRGAAGADRNNAPEVAKDADNAADQRKTPQNTVSLKHSHSLSHSHSDTPPIAIATPPKGGRRAAGRIPDDFEPTAEMIAQAVGFGVPVERIPFETAQWRDHHAAKGDAVRDVPASWRTWMRNDVKYGVRGSPGGLRAVSRASRIDVPTETTITGKVDHNDLNRRLQEVEDRQSANGHHAAG